MLSLGYPVLGRRESNSFPCYLTMRLRRPPCILIAVVSIKTEMCFMNKRVHCNTMHIGEYLDRKEQREGRPGGSVVKRPTSVQVMISRSVGSSPASGSVLTQLRAWSLLQIVSPALSAPPPLTLCLSLSKKIFKKEYFLRRVPVWLSC